MIMPLQRSPTLWWGTLVQVEIAPTATTMRTECATTTLMEETLQSFYPPFHSDARTELLHKKGDQTEKLLDLVNMQQSLDAKKHNASTSMENIALKNKDAKLLDKEVKLTTIIETHSNNLVKRDLNLRKSPKPRMKTPLLFKKKRLLCCAYKCWYKSTFNKLGELSK